MDLLYLFRVLLRKKWIILSLSLLSAICAFVFVMFKKDLYESVAQYSTGFTAEKVRLTDGSAAVDVYTLDLKFNNVIETFKSPKVIGMLSYRLMLHDLENPANAFKSLNPDQKEEAVYKAISRDTIISILKNKILTATLLSPSDNTDKKILEFLKLYNYDYDGLRKLLLIRRVDRTDYLDIIYLSENPQLSAYVVNTLGAEFLNYYRTLNNLRTTESAESIQQLLTLQQKKVDSLTNEMMVARISQGALDPVEQSKNALETIKELQIELSTAQSDYNLYSNLYKGYNERLSILTASLNSNNGQNTLLLFNKRDSLRELLSKSGESNPDLARQLDNVEAQIKAQSGSTTNRPRVQTDIADLQLKLGDAKARMDAASATIRQLNNLIATAKGGNISPKSQVEIDAIQSQLDLENNGLKNLKEKLNQAEGLIKDDPTANFRQTLVGEPNYEPVPKKRTLTTGLAGMATFVILCLIFLIREIFDSSIKTPSQFEKIIRLELKGVLNTVNLTKHQVSNLILNDFQESKNKKEVLFKNNIRKLRYEIDKTGKQIFLITSTQKNVGKTTIIQSLAFSFLLSNKKVLLIDLNFENNELTRIFNKDQFVEDVALETVDVSEMEEEIDETDYSNSSSNNLFNESLLLEDVAPKRELQLYQIESASMNTEFHNLYILGCKGGNHSPSELVSFDLFSYLVKEVRKKFDYVLIESASLNNRADSYELFQIADSVITVFSATTIPTQSDYKSIESIRNLGEKNFGAVLNMVESENLDL